MSGRYSYTVGAAGGVITNGRPNALPLNVSTIADNLRAGGWRCMAAGKWDLGMHAWSFTPTFRGFEEFVGFYNAAEDHFSHHVGSFLDLRNGTDPLASQKGVYSTILYSSAVVSFIVANDPRGRDHQMRAVQPEPDAAHAGDATCRNVSLLGNWSVGPASIGVQAAQTTADCCHLCASHQPAGSCAAFSLDRREGKCYLKNSTTHSHAKEGVISGVIRERPLPPSPSPPPPVKPVPAPPPLPPVPGGASAPLFMYLAFQAVHSPLEAPDHYVSMCPNVKQPSRKVLCGMMHAVDEGVKNITDALKATLRWDNTLVVFTTDNGGTGSSAGTNYPLRGEKATMWEGGVRAVGFVSGFGLQSKVRGTTSAALLHVSDWLPTLVAGVANLQIHQPAGGPPLDGVNAWGPIASGAEHNRTELLLNLCPDFAVLSSARIRPGWQQSAIRHGHWKLIWGLPGDEDAPGCKAPSCKNGWQKPPRLGNASWPAAELPDVDVYSPGVWLFNVTADLEERNNLASSHPDVVSFLKSRIASYNMTHVWQASEDNPPLDPRSDPKNFGSVWSPWLSN